MTTRLKPSEPAPPTAAESERCQERPDRPAGTTRNIIVLPVKSADSPPFPQGIELQRAWVDRTGRNVSRPRRRLSALVKAGFKLTVLRNALQAEAGERDDLKIIDAGLSKMPSEFFPEAA